MKSQLKVAKMNYLEKRCFDLLLLRDKVASYLVFTEAQKYTLKQKLKRIMVTYFQKKILSLAGKKKKKSHAIFQSYSADDPT